MPLSKGQKIRRPSPRRAPRLGPDELIAPHITRLGRFGKRDPRKPRELPGCARVIGAVAWAAFVVEVLRRAWRRDTMEHRDAE